ncbi:MAG: cytochrome b N-terminal domain-containing protein [Armatimonadetes bacterium]|nr:cytochrome b N-terminal domain-containing protein [Armatimonadota bacterium]
MAAIKDPQEENVSLRQTVAQWLEERIGASHFIKENLDEPMPVGVGWLYTLGSCLLTVLIVQMITGIILALYYAPTPDHAYDSVYYITQHVLLGGIVRGIHHYGASVIIIIMGLHVLRSFYTGAYKKPRELTWMIGVLIMAVIFGFAFTGYLLPWDMKAYWATVVGTHIAGTMPFIGKYLERALDGGRSVGALTLTRFYAIHVLVLPALLIALTAAHLYMVRHHHIAGPPTVREGQRKPFYPDQVAKDAIVALLVIGILLGFAAFVKVKLDAVADPANATFRPTPEWYYMSLYQFLKYLPSGYEIIGTLIVPGVIGLALFLLPWLDRGPSRMPKDRKAVLGIGTAIVIAVGVLTYLGMTSISPAAQHGVTLANASPLAQKGEQLYNQSGCSSCHMINGQGATVGPDLSNEGKKGRSLQWQIQHLMNPPSVSPGSIMPSFQKLGPDNIKALATFVNSLGVKGGAAPPAAAPTAPPAAPTPAPAIKPATTSAKPTPSSITPSAKKAPSASTTAPGKPKAKSVAKSIASIGNVQAGAKVFAESGCSSCHMIDGKGGTFGPNLTKEGTHGRSMSWQIAHLMDPQSKSPGSIMPSFKKLGSKKIHDLATFLNSLGSK